MARTSDKAVGRELLNVRQVAAIIGKSVPRTYALVEAGVVPSIRVAGRITIPRRALDEWLGGLADEALAGVRR